eukprot:COSAG01_NODE_1266_length_10987_cov_8.631980_4_plen_91_part_00
MLRSKHRFHPPDDSVLCSEYPLLLLHVQVRLRRLLASEMMTAAAGCASSAGGSFSGGSGVVADMASPVASFRREVDALYAALGLSDDEDG